MGTVHSGQLQDRYNMAKFLILSACLALSSAAPASEAWNAGLAGHGLVAGGLAAGPLIGGAHVAHGPVAVHERVHAGPAVAQHRTITGVVGHRQIQVGTQQVHVGHQYAQTGEVSNPRAAYTQIASPAPIPGPAYNLGPAPLDAVTTVAVNAPVRTHTIITPKLNRIEPELQVNKVPYDVPVAVPVPVERIVVTNKHVPKPYEVAVPRAVPVPQPYKVHPVQRVVETPVIHKKTVSVHQPVVHTAVRTAVHTVAAAPAVAVHAAPAAVGAYGLAGAGAYGLAGGYGLGLAHGAVAAPG